MSKNQLRRKSDWPFPPEDYIVKVNPVGNTAKDYTADFYQSDVPASIPQVVTSTTYVNPAIPNSILFPPLVGSVQTAGVGPVVPSDIGEEYDPTGGSLNEPGKKADAGKLLPWLFFSGFANALEKVAEVTTLGAKKYTPGGWATVANGPERYMEAAMRHLIYLGQGEKLDNGPGGIGTLHKAQIIWNLLASLELELREEKKT